MIFKLAEAAEKSWRRLDGHNQLPKVVLGIKFDDGIEVIRSQAQVADNHGGNRPAGAKRIGRKQGKPIPIQKSIAMNHSERADLSRMRTASFTQGRWSVQTRVLFGIDAVVQIFHLGSNVIPDEMRGSVASSGFAHRAGEKQLAVNGRMAD
jgi:hypothetical protein